MADAFVTIKPDVTEFPEKIRVLNDSGTEVAVLFRDQHYQVTGPADDPKLIWIVDSSSTSI